MAKSLSITVYPSALEAEYLSVSDAMNQVLDLIDAIGALESSSTGQRQIVWRLVEAHTNSPPFTITAEAYSANPTVSVGIEAERVAAAFCNNLETLLSGSASQWVDPDFVPPLKRALDRNLNGVSRTSVRVEGHTPIEIVPTTAMAAVVAIERIHLAEQIAEVDYRHTEFGSIEAMVFGLGRWNDKPALIVVDRLSSQRITCVLSDDLVRQLGPSHSWEEIWSDKRLLVEGALHYGQDGNLKRIDADYIEECPWADVSLADLEGIDLLNGMTVNDRLNSIREGDNG